MKNFDWKKLKPHAIAVAIFLVVTLFYCKPALQGKVLQQSDITQWTAMAKDQYNYMDKHNGDVPLWSNGMFSGMPGYLIVGKSNSHVGYYFSQALSLFLPKPFQFFFLACICFYFLALSMGARSWVGIIGALCYAYATYNPIIVAVGHDTKMLTIALLPGFLASLIWVYEKKYWTGAALVALFTASLISQNHYQVVYYGILAAFFMTIAYAIHWIMNKEWKHLLVAGCVTVLAALTGIMTNAVVIFPNYEYTKETIRGGSELADKTSKIGKDGLSQSYAFSYSMYKTEPLVMMFPRMYGGESGYREIEEDKSKAIAAFRDGQQAAQTAPQELVQKLQYSVTTYWGGIGGTSGPPYAGAIICFLALVGFAVLDGKHKWWILAACVLTFMMSWGGFFEGFNGFLLNHLPMYNKFRAPSMIIIVPTLLLGMMATLTLERIAEAEQTEAFLNKYKKGLMIAGGVFVLALLLYFTMDYKTAGDIELSKQISSLQDANAQSWMRSIMNGLVSDRQGLFFSDILRSLFFAAVAAAALWFYIKKKLPLNVMLAVVGIFAFIDVMAIDVTYLNGDNYKDKEESDNAFAPRPVDTEILKDQGYYRVLDLSSGDIGSVFNQGAMPTSYFHKSIGGYHPAKLSIYQDLIEKQLYNFPNCMPVINMLNTKYIITGQDKNMRAMPNPNALGAAWFVKHVNVVESPQQVMNALTTLNTKDTAVAEKGFTDLVKGNFTTDSAAKIELVKNDNDITTYKTSASSAQFAVFSEVYYDKGWNAYLDGNKVPYAKVNYVLRGMPVPAGNHEIVFKFEPRSHALGWTITNIAGLLTLLLVGVSVWMGVRKRKVLG